jgi:hypothetical protein
MRGVFEADHFLHLEVDVAVDEVVVEHAAGLYRPKRHRKQMLATLAGMAAALAVIVFLIV